MASSHLQQHQSTRRPSASGLPGQAAMSMQRPDIAEQEHLQQPESSGNSGENNPFRPFFVLVKDTKTQEYHHPTVRYIFADDDDSIITEAAVRSAEAQSGAFDGSGIEQEDVQVEEDTAQSLLPPVQPGVQEQYIVLDVAPTEPRPEEPRGQQVPNEQQPPSQQQPPESPAALNTSNARKFYSPSSFQVLSAKSFSPAFQILNTRLSTAPSLNSPSDEGSPKSVSAEAGPVANNIILQIEGASGSTFRAEDKQARDKELQEMNVEQMMTQLEAKMKELKQIVDLGGDRDFLPPDMATSEGVREGDMEGGYVGPEGDAFRSENVVNS